MTTEFRFVSVEIRESATGPGRVEGIAVRYGDEATLPGFRERFQAGAFGDIAALDVIANLHHQRDRPLARTGGSGLTFTDEATALRATLDLPDTRDGRDAAALLRRGVLRGFSLEFRVEGERFEGGVRIVERAALRGLALVDRPAYGERRESGGDCRTRGGGRGYFQESHAPEADVALTPAATAAGLRLVYLEADYSGSAYTSIIPRLLDVAVAQVERHAPNAPDAVKDEATLRLVGWLFDSGGWGTDERPAVSSAGALVKSGAASLLKPWRVHRAGAC